MTKKLFLLLFYTLLVSVSMATAQQKKYRFTDEMCEYEGVYNTHLYNEQELKDTHSLYYGESWLLGYGSPHKDSPDDTKQLLTQLADDYAKKRNVLRGFKVIDKPIFTLFRDSLILSLDEEYKAKSTILKAYLNSASILQYKTSDCCNTRYAIPLSKGGEVLLEAYKQLTLDQMKKNAAPQLLYKQYQQNLASPDKYEKAFAYVVTYGWWNCVNSSIPRPKYDPQFMETYQSLFTKVTTIYCDEP